MTIGDKIKKLRMLQKQSHKLLDQIYDKRSLKIESVKQAVDFIQTLSPIDKEVVYVIFMDSKHVIIDIKKIDDGIVNQAVVYPRVVIQEALNMGAVFVILVHNHPSGDPQPSNEDIAITKRLFLACFLVDINLIDSIILGKKRKRFSFFDSGLINKFTKIFIKMFKRKVNFKRKK
jgi:DNA repair protein RadC